MSSLNKFSSKLDLPGKSLTGGEIFSICYHNIFDYPLSFDELIKWTPAGILSSNKKVCYKNGYYFLEGRAGLIYKRSVRSRLSARKMGTAKKAAKILILITTIKMLGITGSLAMDNAGNESDIDLIVITKKGNLWITRILSYITLYISGFSLRTPGNKMEKDKLCVNIWLDESDLKWPKKDRNYYTAHEVLQIKPLVNRGEIFERFVLENKWAFDYWPKALKIKKPTNNIKYSKVRKLNLINLLAFNLQRAYMKSKRTRETVTITRAIFHPNDLSKKTLDRLKLS